MTLSLEALRPEHLPRLFAYWRALGAEIPYFFPVPLERWRGCLLADRLDGELIFKQLETTLAFDADRAGGEPRLVGFVQYGQPNFAWNENGEQYGDPPLGVIRHFYFERGSPQAGRALLAQADAFLARFAEQHAFYHILGMSCNAYHGKLHNSLNHVEALLLEDGFQIGHENAYYVMDLKALRPAGQGTAAPFERQVFGTLEMAQSAPAPGVERIEARLAGVPAATAEIRLIEPERGGPPDTAYLGWLGVERAQQGRGLGTIFLSAIAEQLKSRGCRWLHTDTAGTNLGAQRFYTSFGFHERGRTRSYQRFTGGD